MRLADHLKKAGSAAVLSAAVLLSASGCQGGALNYEDFFELQKSYIISQISSRSEVWFRSFGSDTLARTITLSADVKGTALDKYQVFFDKSSLSFALSVSEEKALAAGELIINGEHLIGASGTLDKDTAVFCLPDADNAMYSASADSFFKIIGAEGLTVKDILRKQPTEKELKKSLEALLDTIGSAVTKDTVAVEANQPVEMKYSENKELKCTVLTYTPEKESLTQMFGKLADLIETDPTISSMMNITTMENGVRKTLSAAEAAEKLRTNASAYADKLISEGFQWKLAVEGHEIRRSSLLSGGEEFFAAEVSGSSDKGGETALYAADESFLFRDTFTVEGKERKGTILLSTKESDLDAEYQINRENYSVLGLPVGTYHFTLNNSSLPGEADMTVSRNDDGSYLHKITVKSGAAGFTLNLTASNIADIRIPAGTPTDITDYSQEQLNQILQDVQTSLLMNLYPLLMKLGLAGY